MHRKGAETEVHLHRVVLLQDGQSFLWEEAREAWASGTDEVV